MRREVSVVEKVTLYTVWILLTGGGRGGRGGGGGERGEGGGR